MTTPSTYLNQLYNAPGMVATQQQTQLPAGQIAAGGSTTTSSTAVTLNINAPAWVIAGMPVYDVTAGGYVGLVSSTSGTGVTLAANSSTAIATGDILQFGYTPSDLAVGAAATADIRGLTELAWLKLNEAKQIITYLTSDVITNSQDSHAYTILYTDALANI